jgi:hypothetical protein
MSGNQPDKIKPVMNDTEALIRKRMRDREYALMLRVKRDNPSHFPPEPLPPPTLPTYTPTVGFWGI